MKKLILLSLMALSYQTLVRAMDPVVSTEHDADELSPDVPVFPLKYCALGDDTSVVPVCPCTFTVSTRRAASAPLGIQAAISAMNRRAPFTLPVMPFAHYLHRADRLIRDGLASGQLRINREWKEVMPSLTELVANQLASQRTDGRDEYGNIDFDTVTALEFFATGCKVGPSARNEDDQKVPGEREPVTRNLKF